MTCTNLSEIRALNLAYLQFARVNLENDRKKGEQLLGLTPEVAQVIVTMTDAQQINLAGGSQMLCAFKVSDFTLLMGLAEKVSSADLAALTRDADVREAVAA
jgi:flagellar transcriptional activator FlhD